LAWNRRTPSGDDEGSSAGRWNGGRLVIRPYRTIPDDERNRTLDHEDQLAAAAANARHDGWLLGVRPGRLRGPRLGLV
jgi:hypothetical protein